MPRFLAGRLLLGAVVMAVIGPAQAAAVALGDVGGPAVFERDAAVAHEDESPAAERGQTFDALEGFPIREAGMETVALGYRDRTGYWAAMAKLEVREPSTLALLGLGLVLIAGLAPGVANRRPP